MNKVYQHKKLNLGCGKDIKEGYVNLDFLKLKGVNIIHDLDIYPYPFENNEFEEIYCNSVLEHIKDISRTMQELHRILKPEGKLKIIVPHFTASNSYKDPTHKHHLSYFSFDFYTGNSFYHKFKFKLVERKLEFGKKFALWNHIIEPFANKFPILYEDTPLRMFPALNIIITIKK